MPAEAKPPPEALRVDTVVQDVEKLSSQTSDTPPSPTLDAAIERRLLRKLDVAIYPILFIVYMLFVVDRVNISNAKILGMTEDLDLAGNRFNVALFVCAPDALRERERAALTGREVFFVPYILFEVPSNMLIRKVRPSGYLGGLMFCWGIVNMCMGFVQTYAGLVGLRILLGAFEAGVLPGIIYLTSMYYRRYEYQKRISILFGSTIVGNIFGGFVAYGIAHLGARGGYGPWRWIFITEGAITALVAIPAAFIIVDWPERCKYLTPDERILVRRRVEADVGDACRMDTLNAFALKLIFGDYKIWLG